LQLRVECTLFCNLQSQVWHLVIGLYELLGKSNYLTHWATRVLSFNTNMDHNYNQIYVYLNNSSLWFIF
jgi:hypothetical protein